MKKKKTVNNHIKYGSVAVACCGKYDGSAPIHFPSTWNLVTGYLWLFLIGMCNWFVVVVAVAVSLTSASACACRHKYAQYDWFGQQFTTITHFSLSHATEFKENLKRDNK